MANVNSPPSAIGIARGGKTPSRILPVEGDQLRAVGPQPRSESTGEATRRPEGTHLVAEGKFAKAATWAGEVHQVVNLSQLQLRVGNTSTTQTKVYPNLQWLLTLGDALP